MRQVKFREMLESLRQDLSGVPEHRTGRNTQYTIVEAGLAAFSVFYMQSPSFLAHQRDMERKKGRNNARSLFGVERIPSDGQIRNLLDPVEPGQLGGSFWEVYRYLDEGGHLEQYRGVGGTRLVSLDGSQYFSSHALGDDGRGVCARTRARDLPGPGVHDPTRRARETRLRTTGHQTMGEAQCSAL